MKKSNKLSLKDIGNAKEEVKTQENKDIHYRRIKLELSKIDTYIMNVEVPLRETPSEENTHAIKLAWTMIKNAKAVNLEKCRMGDGFHQKILERIEVNSDGERVLPKGK